MFKLSKGLASRAMLFALIGFSSGAHACGEDYWYDWAKTPIAPIDGGAASAPQVKALKPGTSGGILGKLPGTQPGQMNCTDMTLLVSSYERNTLTETVKPVFIWGKSLESSVVCYQEGCDTTIRSYQEQVARLRERGYPEAAEQLAALIPPEKVDQCFNANAASPESDPSPHFAAIKAIKEQNQGNVQIRQLVEVMYRNGISVTYVVDSAGPLITEKYRGGGMDPKCKKPA